MEDIVRSELTKEYEFEVFERTVPQGGFWDRNLFRVRRFLRFFNTARSGHYLCVHIQSPDPAFMGTTVFVLLSRLAGVKVLLHVHGTDWDSFYPDVSGVKKLVTRLGLCLANRIVVLYEAWVRHIKAVCPAADVRVLMNRIHRQAPLAANLVEALRESLKLDRGNFVVLTVGSVGRRKGHFEILRAVPVVAAEDDSVRFVFVGGEEKPGEMAQIIEVVERAELHRWVRITGERDRTDVPIYLAISDMFLLPSFFEGAPITILEAMRSGVAMVSTPVAGIPELIENGVSGLLVPPGAPHKIAEAVLLLRTDNALRQRLGACGKAAFNEKFEFSKGIAELRNLYESF